jgi:hypothetical protein
MIARGQGEGDPCSKELLRFKNIRGRKESENV